MAATTALRGKAPPRQPEKKIGNRAESNAGKGKGPVHAAVQITRKAFKGLANQQKGLIGEHMVDYHKLKRLGGDWPHDKPQGAWSPVTVHKLNVDKHPVNLSLVDLPKVNHQGIDAVWQHGTHYTVTEAKTRESIFALRAAAAKFGNQISKALSTDLQELYFLLHDNSDKRNANSTMVQMSWEWVQARAPSEDMSSVSKKQLLAKNAERRVVLVTLESSGASDHVQAWGDVCTGKSSNDMQPHSEHGKTKAWEAADIDKAVAARTKAYEAKQNKPAGTADTSQPEPAKNKQKSKTKTKTK